MPEIIKRLAACRVHSIPATWKRQFFRLLALFFLVGNTATAQEQPSGFNAGVELLGPPDQVRMAPGGGYFLSQREALRLWKIEDNDAVLIFEWDQALPGLIEHRAAVSPDGSKVALQVSETRGRLFGSDQTESFIRVVDIATGEDRDIEIDELDLGSVCGMDWVGAESQLLVCINYAEHGGSQLFLLEGEQVRDSWLLDDIVAPIGGDKKMFALSENRLQLEGAATTGSFDRGNVDIVETLVVLDIASGQMARTQNDFARQIGITESGILLYRYPRSFEVAGTQREINQNTVPPPREIIQNSAPLVENDANIFFQSGIDEMLFAVNDGLEALSIGESSVARLNFGYSGVTVLDFRVGSDGRSMIAVTDEGVRKLVVTQQRQQAMVEYMRGWEMLESGFAELGMARITEALTIDPSMTQLNAVHPYLHNFVRYLDEVEEELEPAIYGQLALALFNAASERIDGELVSIDIGFRSLFSHGLFALIAGQPGIARQSLSRLQAFNNDVVSNDDFPPDRKPILDAWSDMLEALIMGYGGDIDGAYDLLAERGGLVRLDFTAAARELQRRYPYTMPLWQSKTKLAFVLDEDVSELDEEFQPEYLNRPMLPYPDLSGQMIQPVQAAGAGQTGGTTSAVQQTPGDASTTPPAESQPNRPAGQILD